MKNKYKLTALVVALSLGFTACANDADKKVDDATTKVEEAAEDAKDKAEEGPLQLVHDPLGHHHRLFCRDPRQAADLPEPGQRRSGCGRGAPRDGKG